MKKKKNLQRIKTNNNLEREEQNLFQTHEKET